jgi:3-dehydroquinate synthase
LDDPAEDVIVPLDSRTYVVRVVSGDMPGFGPFARSALDSKWAGKGCRRGLVVTDTNLQGHIDPYLGGLEGAGIEVEVAVVPAGEASKGLVAAEALYDLLVASKADRHVCVVALGGGVIGDLAGFVASTYARGLPLLMVPTTLLAQVDSSVGGKVGINHPDAKNIIGAFHQPVGVWIDTASLSTLPDRELRCGLAEVVKYGVILDADFFDEVESTIGAILDREPGALRRIIARSCRLKADVVSKDEREETGLRAVLNYGHTVGHAIEAVAGYGGAFRHGEAVAVGMVAEARIAERIGWIGPDVAERLIRLLDRIGLPTAAPRLDAGELIDAMGRDKKNKDGRTRFVLPRRLGHVDLTDAPTESDIRAVLASLT